MDDAYEACRNELASTLEKYVAQLVPFRPGTPDSGGRFDFEVGPVLVRGALRKKPILRHRRDKAAQQARSILGIDDLGPMSLFRLEDTNRLAYIRGPEGIIVGLNE